MAEDPYRDEQLVELYDIDNAAGDDHAYYRALADAVTWIHGDATALEDSGDFDLAVSSGNTMMHITPEAYPAVLGCLGATLRRGGSISFESRCPDAREWECWNPAETYAERETPFGRLREWLQVIDVEQGRVVFDAHNVFQDGREAVYTTVLYFRTVADIASDLERAGFGDIDVRGGWHNEPVTADSRVLVFRATWR